MRGGALRKDEGSKSGSSSKPSKEMLANAEPDKKAGKDTPFCSEESEISRNAEYARTPTYQEQRIS
jgi:hypothetical protein